MHLGSKPCEYTFRFRVLLCGLGKIMLNAPYSRSMSSSHHPAASSPFSEIVDCVREFHDRFGIANAPELTGSLSEEVVRLRHRLMAEETEEYLEAALHQDTVEIADALGDQLYILCGTILSHGMQHVIEKVFKEIQASNMSKLGTDGQPIYREDGKVMKGPEYFRPNIAGVLEQNHITQEG